MTTTMLELVNVSIGFHGETLLKNISLKIARGESFVLIGPSGLGKSVILKLLAGLLEPSEGQVLVEGQDLHELPRNERVKLLLKMGMLFQKNALFDSLSVSENIAFPLREVSALSENEISSRVAFFLEQVGLSEARERFPDEISGGMQKRLGIARALALHPEIVLYDDPTAGLDPITSRRIIDLILTLKEKGNSTLVSITNDMVRAEQLADRIGMVVDGELLVANKSQLRNHPDPRISKFVRGQA